MKVKIQCTILYEGRGPIYVFPCLFVCLFICLFILFTYLFIYFSLFLFWSWGPRERITKAPFHFILENPRIPDTSFFLRLRLNNKKLHFFTTIPILILIYFPYHALRHCVSLMFHFPGLFFSRLFLTIYNCLVG
jgi:hypothetical protein